MSILSLAKLLKTKIQGMKILPFLCVAIILSAFLFTAHMFRYEPVGDGSMLYDRWMNKLVPIPSVPSDMSVANKQEAGFDVQESASDALLENYTPKPLFKDRASFEAAMNQEHPPLLDIAIRELKNKFWLTAEPPEGQAETQRIWDQQSLYIDIRKMGFKAVGVVQDCLGNIYHRGYLIERNDKKAFDWWSQAAHDGNAEAQVMLGTAYHEGGGVEKNYREAIKWWLIAADEHKNADAQAMLGEAYYEGDGVEKNFIESVKWLRKAAEQCNALAQYNLGNAYHNGEGVEQDNLEAVKWYRKAAEGGIAGAQFILGIAYLGQPGIERDHKEAVKWLNKAAAQGNTDARDYLNKYEK